MKVMRLVLLLAAAIYAAAAFDMATAPALDDEIIEKVNKGNFGWTAGKNKKFTGLSVADAAKMLRAGWTFADPKAFPVYQYHAAAIPDSFDSREEFKGCVHPIRDQAQCGSCWAFAASEALSDRFCIASKGAFKSVLSPQAMVSCDTRNYGCNGGYLDRSWSYLEKTGIPTDSCYPYTSGNGVTGTCKPNTCADGSDWKVYKAVTGSSKRFADIPSIQTDMMANGPVEAAFTVYQDFFSYTSGVYSHQFGGMAGGHAIKVVGWGVDASSQKPYWIVANSWGEDWGMKGFFWILRGTNECGIENQMYAGLANTACINSSC